MNFIFLDLKLFGVTKSTLRHAQCIAFAVLESMREKRSIDI